MHWIILRGLEVHWTTFGGCFGHFESTCPNLLHSDSTRETWPLGGDKTLTFSTFLINSESAHQNQWENGLGGGIFKLFAIWTTLVPIRLLWDIRLAFDVYPNFGQGRPNL